MADFHRLHPDHKGMCERGGHQGQRGEASCRFAAPREVHRVRNGGRDVEDEWQCRHDDPKSRFCMRVSTSGPERSSPALVRAVASSRSTCTIVRRH